MSTRKLKYRVVGNHKDGYAVVQGGAIEYDLLETRSDANAIRDVLNDGFGPEWEAVEAELERRRTAERRGA